MDIPDGQVGLLEPISSNLLCTHMHVCITIRQEGQMLGKNTSYLLSSQLEYAELVYSVWLIFMRWDWPITMQNVCTDCI